VSFGGTNLQKLLTFIFPQFFLSSSSVLPQFFLSRSTGFCDLPPAIDNFPIQRAVNPPAPIEPIDWPARIQAGLSRGERRVIEDAAAALERERGRLSWESWMRVGEALTIIRNAALKITDMKIPLGRRYSDVFGTSLRRFEIKIDPGVIARLFEVMRNRGAIEDWRASLSSAERGRINHPQKVLQRWRKSQQQQTESTL
jgi:hypothetical protein